MRRDCRKPNSSWVDKFFASMWRGIQLRICTGFGFSRECCKCVVCFCSQSCTTARGLNMTKHNKTVSRDQSHSTHKLGHFRDILPSQSLNSTQQKQTCTNKP